MVVDGDLEPVAQIRFTGGHPYLWPDSEGRYLMAHDDDRVYLVDLGQARTEALTPSTTWPLDWVRWNTRKAFYSAWVVPFEGGLAVINAIDSGTCRIARYSAHGEAPSDHEYPCWQAPDPFIGISPDGRFVAIGRGGALDGDSGLGQIRTTSIFDTTTGEERLRVRGAGEPGERGTLADAWLADSSGIVVRTSRGERLVTNEGRWESAPGVPAPGDPNVFAQDTTVRNRAGRLLAALEFGPPAREIRGIRDTLVKWGGASTALRVTTGIYYESGGGRWALPADAAIEHPPFDDRPLVEVVVDTCLNLREEPSLDAPILACLPNGAVVERDDFQSPWMHLRTDDGLEGWASAEYLRWHSDGVRLEE